MDGRQERLEKANHLIKSIAANGRNFLSSKVVPWDLKSPTVVAQFEIDERGRVWYIDHWSGKRIYAHYDGPWKDFTGGGTLKNLVKVLATYIAKGERLHPGYFGPWPKWYSQGDPWGYGTGSMEMIRKKARDLGLVRDCG